VVSGLFTKINEETRNHNWAKLHNGWNDGHTKLKGKKTGMLPPLKWILCVLEAGHVHDSAWNFFRSSIICECVDMKHKGGH
jgi:hypothetical protein